MDTSSEIIRGSKEKEDVAEETENRETRRDVPADGDAHEENGCRRLTVREKRRRVTVRRRAAVRRRVETEAAIGRWQLKMVRMRMTELKSQSL